MRGARSSPPTLQATTCSVFEIKTVFSREPARDGACLSSELCVLGFVVPADRAGVPARAGQARHFLGGGEDPCRRRANSGVALLSRNLHHRRDSTLQLPTIYIIYRFSPYFVGLTAFSFHTYELPHGIDFVSVSACDSSPGHVAAHTKASARIGWAAPTVFVAIVAGPRAPRAEYKPGVCQVWQPPCV